MYIVVYFRTETISSVRQLANYVFFHAVNLTATLA